MRPTNYLVIIAGPTAVGKTSLSIDLAKQFQAPVLSADARQFYKEMAIGTAKPSPEDMQGVPHYFIDHISIHDRYSVGQYEQEVMALSETLFQKHRLIFLVGGSGLYIDAVKYGVDSFDEVPETVRTSIATHYQQQGLSWLQEELQRLDPEYYAMVDQQNPQRLIRALEVSMHTGKPYSSFRTRQAKDRPFELVPILIEEERDVLYDRINRRVDAMMAQGLLKEVEGLYPYKHLNALNTVGYKELFAYLDHEQTLEEAIEQIKQNTRRYAKRQMTWFRHHGPYETFSAGDADKIKSYLEVILEHS